MKSLFCIVCLYFFSIVLYSQPQSWQSKGIGGGGALFSPSINPSNANEYYVACDMSELFHSSDNGMSYSQVHFSQFQSGIYSKVCYTSVSGLLYSISMINDISAPVKSADGGKTWSILQGNPDESEETYSIDADYHHPGRIIISYYSSIYFSDNAGTSFKQIHTAVSSGTGNLVGGILFDGDSIYIGTNDGLIVSVNGGSTFNVVNISGIPSDEKIFSFSGARSGNVTRFFCLTGSDGDVYPGVRGSDYWDFVQGVYSVDFGAGNWVSKMTGITVGTDYPMFVAMAGNNINTVYLGGSNNDSEITIMKTTDAGAHWTHVFMTSSNQNIITGWSGSGGDRQWSYGECVLGIDVADTHPDTVLFSDLGFVHKTDNGGTTWKQAYVSSADQNPATVNTPKGKSYHSIGIENTSCWQVLWSDANNIFSAYSDIRGLRSTDAGASWSFNYTGLNANTTYRIVKHPSNGTLFAATSNIHDMYQSTRLQDNILDANDSEGKILYSANNGQTWQTLHLFSHPVFWITIDPINSNRAYASVIHYNNGTGIGGIYQCNDLQNLASSTWTLLTDPPRTQKHPACIVVLNDGKAVCSFSGRRNSSGAFTNSSGVFIYDPVGNSWTDVSDPGMYYWTKDIVIDPNDNQQNTWYAGVFSGWGGAPNGLGGLYKTTDRGKNWTRISNLDRVTSCTFNPGNANEIYMTTEQNGLWICSNVNAAIPVFTPVENYPFRQPERVYFNPFNAKEIWITSFGNGMKCGLLNETGIEKKEENPFMTIFPNPAEQVISVFLSGVPGKTEGIEVISETGQILRQNQVRRGIHNDIPLTGLPEGIYFIRCGEEYQKLVIKK